MEHKRHESRRLTAESRGAETAAATEHAPHGAAPSDHAEVRDVEPWLRQLGFRAVEARRGSALCAQIPEASLDQRLRMALTGLAPHVRKVPPPSAT